MYANKNKTKNSKARTVATKADSTKLSSTDSRYDAGDYEAVPASIRKIRDARNKELEEQNAIPAEEIIARQEAEIAELKRQAAAGSAPSTMADKYRNAIDDLEDHPTFKNPESMADFGDYEAVASTARFAAAERDPNQKVFRAKPSVATRKVASPSDLSPGDYEAVAAAARHAVSPDEYLAAKEAQSDNEEPAESVAQDTDSGYMTDAEAARASRQAPSREVPEYTAPAPAPADNEVHSEPYTPPMAAQSSAVSSSSDEVHSEPYTPPKAPQAPPAPVSAADYTVEEYVPPAQRNKYSDDGNYDVGGGPIYSPTSGKRIASFEDMAPGDYEAVADSSYDDSEMDLADGSYDFDKFLAGAPSLQTPRAPQPSPEESDWADLGPSVTEDIDDVDITDEQTRALTEAIAQETLNNQPGTQFEDIIDNVIAKVLERKKAEDAAKAVAQQPEHPEQKPEEQKAEHPEQKPEEQKAEQPEQKAEEKPAEPPADEKPAEQTEAQPTAEKQTAEEPQKATPSEVIDPSTPIEDIPALIMAQFDSADGEANDDDIRKSIDAALIGKLTTGELTLDSVQSVRNKILDEIHEMQEEEARILAQLEGKPEKHPFDPDFLPADIAVEDIPDAVIAELDNIEGEVSDDEVKESIDKVMIAKLAKGELTLDDFQDARESIFDTLGIETAEEQAEETEREPVEEAVEEPTEPEPVEEAAEEPIEPVEETETEPVEEAVEEPTESVEETEPEPVEETVEEPTEPVEETEPEPVEETAEEPVEEEPEEETTEPEEPAEEEPVEVKTEETQAEEPTEPAEETESEPLEETAEEEPIQGPDVELSEAAEQTEESSEELIEEPVVEPIEEPVEETAEEPAEENNEGSGEEPVDEVAEEPVEEETAQEQAPAESEHAQNQEASSEDEEEETVGIPVPKEPTVLEYDPYADVFVNPKDESEESAEDEEDTDESEESAEDEENTDESADEENKADEKADEEGFDDEQPVNEETVSTEETVAETEESEESAESEELLETPLSAAAVLAMQDQAEETEEVEEAADEEPVEETEDEPEVEEAEEPAEETEPDQVEEVEESVEEVEPEQVEETEETEEAEEEEPEAEEVEEPVEETEEDTQPEQTEESEEADNPAEESEEHDSVLDMQITFDDIFRNPFVNDFEPLETPEEPTEEATANDSEEAETDEPAPVEEEPEPEEEPAPVENEPAQEESPAEEQTPVEEEAQEESPTEEQTPAENEPAQEESPAEEQESVEEEPAQEESPAEDKAPAEEETQQDEVSEEEPAPVDEAPTQEESPAEEPEAPDEYAEAKEKRHEDMQNALLMAMIDDKEKTFSDAVNYMIDQDELNARTLRTRMPIDKDTLDHVIKKRDFIPDKKTALAICFALRLTWEDSIRLLYKAGYSLNDTERYDLTIEYLMRRGVYDQNMINSVLRGSGLEGFGTPQSEL